tara:strand:+ start:456 stop:698 length:243 start_codon:yes stop_codon:yes gene_type:complete
MKTANAIKTLEKAGFKVVSPYKGFFSALSQSGKNVIEFLDQDDVMLCVKVRGVKNVDDHHTDYAAGSWCKNLRQAMLLAS